MTKQPYSASQIEEAVRQMTTAAESPLGVEVNTTVIYPTGDAISAFVVWEGDEYQIHDAGFGIGLFVREGSRITKELLSRLVPLAQRYECVLTGGRISRRASPDDVVASVVLVANASRAIADFAAETKRQTDNHFRYAVTERVRELGGQRLRENESFRGKSGAAYRVTNIILDETEQSPVAFLLPVPSRGSVSLQFRELYDLRAAFPSVSRASIYDEGSDFRANEDSWILSEVASVVPFGGIEAALPALLTPSPEGQPPLFIPPPL